MLSFIMPTVAIQSNMLSVVMLSVIMPSVIMLSVVMLNVAAPLESQGGKIEAIFL